MLREYSQDVTQKVDVVFAVTGLHFEEAMRLGDYAASFECFRRPSLNVSIRNWHDLWQILHVELTVREAVSHEVFEK